MNILITGAGRGLGYEMTAEALKRGHSVIAGVRRKEQEPSELSKLANEYGDLLKMVLLDVTNEEGIAELAQSLKEQGQTLGAIINNAGVLLTDRDIPIEQVDIQDLQATMDINLYGPVRVVKHFIQLLTEPKLSIINISSDAGSITNAYGADFAYGISKTALNMFSQQLHVYGKDRDIQVLSVHPGWMHTDMGGSEAPTSPRQSAEGIMDLIEKRIAPEGRYQFVDYTGKVMEI